MIKLILISAAFISFLSIPVGADQISNRPDFVRKDDNGKVTLRGKYTTDDSGYVVRYDLFDGEGELQQTTIPYYANDGRLLEARIFDGKGVLTEVIVIVGEKMIGISASGEPMDKYQNTQVDVQGFLDHFRGKNN